MWFSVLGSGSRGNCIVVRGRNSALLIDCGLSAREIVRRLGAIGLDPSMLTAILLTHEHQDHVKGLKTFANKYRLPIYSNLSFSSLSISRHLELRSFRSLCPFSCGEFTVHPIPVPHDAEEPVGFVVEDQTASLGIFTDVGSVTREVREAVSSVQSLVIESNYDETLLATSEYPVWLRQRIASDNGHLSNTACAELLWRHGTHLYQVVLAHLSRDNNSPGHALPEIHRHWGHQQFVPFELLAASQDNPTPLLACSRETALYHRQGVA